MITYKVIKENLQHCELGRYIAYGICVYSEEARMILKSISDVFIERDKVEKLVALCNENKLDPIHLSEVVQDAIV